MIDLRHGDCIEQMKTLGDGSIDAVITDPPYPEISRDYGRMTEVEWHEMMRCVVAQARRVLKPTGSAVFILQPNSRKVGSMRPWLFEFQAWACREWNMVQDAYWWNHSYPPTVHTHRRIGLMRPSVKHCVWLGNPHCFRDQDTVLWQESQETTRRRVTAKCTRVRHPSGHNPDQVRSYVLSLERGGTTPFNLNPISGVCEEESKANGHHPGSTPQFLCDWWTRYICPPGGTILDPFSGSGTTGLSALKYGCSYVGIEKMPRYHAIAERRLAAASNQTPLFAG